MAVANNNLIPPQGTPGIADGRNPTLIPNFDKPVTGARVGGGSQSPAAFLIANPRVDATATATIAGSVTTGNQLTIELTNQVLTGMGVAGGKIAHTVVAAGGDTVSNLAEKMVNAFNDDLNAQEIDLRADAVLGVITFRQPGLVGNLSTLSKTVVEPATVTLGGTSHTGDRVSVLFTGPGLGVAGVLIQTNPTTGDTPTQMGDALVAAIAANSTLAGLGIVGVNTAGAVVMTTPADDYQVVSWVNTIVMTAVVGGTPDTADTLTLTFTCAALPGGSRTVTYITLVTDTTTALAAAGLLAAINADPVLNSAGITATLVGSTLTIAYPQNIGQLRYSRTVSGTLTITLIVAPTTTAVTTGATETITFSNGGVLSGGTGPVIATNNFNFAYNGQAQSFFYGQPYVLDFPYVTALVNGGAPIV